MLVLILFFSVAAVVDESVEGKGTPGKTQAALRGNTSAREDPPG